MPGVPDTYQGTELWDNSLVDPDNRRPVDFAARRELLARLDAGWRPPIDAERRGEAAGRLPDAAAAPRPAGAVHRLPPVPADGPAAEHAVAFDRGGAVAVATRLPVRLRRQGGWGATTLSLPDGAWTDQFTGDEYPVRTGSAGGAARPVSRGSACTDNEELDR